MSVICFFNTVKSWGGGEKWHFEISQYLHTKNVPVLVVAHPMSVLAQKLKATTIPHKTIALSNLSFINPAKRLAVKNCLKSHSINTIVLNLSSDVKIAGPIAKSLKIDRIIYRRGSAIPIKNTILNRYFFKKVLTEILANSIATKNTILENNSNLFPEEKIKVIYNGVEIPENLNIQNSLHQSTTLFLANLGRLEYQKNQGFLLDVAKQLLLKNVDFKMQIGGEGRLKNELQSRIDNEGLADHVVLNGFVSKPYEFLFQCDLFLLSSHWEGFGYVLAEAAICGKPCVAFNSSSNPEIVLHEETGMLTLPNDVESFVTAIEKFYNNRALISTMGSAGKKYVTAQFEKSKKLEEIEAYLIHG